MADYGIMAAPPGSPHDAGSDSTIRPTTDAAVDAAYAYEHEQEACTHNTGHVLGDRMILPPPPDYDTTLLMPLPGIPIEPPLQGGSYMPDLPSGGDAGSNMGGRS